MVPITTQTQGGNPVSRLLLIPTIVNNPNPIASKRNKVFFHLSIFSLNSNVTSKATAVVRKYLLSSIQNGVIPRNKSLAVPPPIAVTNPIIYAPNQSICLRDASLIPLMANAKVPATSMIVVNKPSNGITDFDYSLCFINFRFFNQELFLASSITNTQSWP